MREKDKYSFMKQSHEVVSKGLIIILSEHFLLKAEKRKSDWKYMKVSCIEQKMFAVVLNNIFMKGLFLFFLVYL